MEQNGSSNLQQLIAERGRVKAALTRLKTCYDTRGDAEPIPSLRLRLSQNLDLRQRYDAIHDRIITAVAGSDDVEAHERSRDEFEDTYYRTYDGHSAGTIANTADDLTSTSPTAPPTAHQSHYRGVADQKRSPKHKSARNRQQAHRDDRCQLNRLRIIGNTGFINAIRSSENIARKEVLHSDNEHHRNRADNIANVPRRHSKIRSVARRNYASAGIQPVAKASATIGTVPTTKFDTVNDRQRNPIADRATRVQRQPRFVRRAARGTVREYQGCVLNANLRPAEQHSPSVPLDGSTDLIGDKLDLLTDLPNNLSNGEPLINNDAQETSRNVAEREEEVDIKDETTNAGVEITHGTHGTVTSIDATTFLPGVYINRVATSRASTRPCQWLRYPGIANSRTAECKALSSPWGEGPGVYTRKLENLDDSDDQLNASSSSPGIDGGSAPPTQELCVTRGLSQSSTFRDDPSVPSISRTYDGHSAGTIANTADDLTSTSPTAPSTAHQSHYRRHSKIRSVARRNYASAGIQPVAKASATIGTVPTTKFDTVNDRQRNPIADRATRVQRQPRFVRRAARGTVREYQGCVLNANLRPAEQHSQSYRQQRVPAAPKPAQTRAVENPVPQSRSVTIQRPFQAKLAAELLLDGEYRSKNISEQNNSRIHTVTSSESTSPYDENPQKKGTSATKNQQTRCLDGKEAMENASYSCSNLSSTTSDSPCVCNLTNARTVTSLDHSIRVHDPHAKKYIPRISSNFNGTNEFFGAAHNLNSSIDASTSRKEFWSQLKCENFPSTPQTIEKIWTKSEQYSHDDIATPEETKNSDDQHDCSDLGSDINVNAINDKTDAYIIEDQQRDEDSNVLDHGHIKESTHSNLTSPQRHKWRPHIPEQHSTSIMVTLKGKEDSIIRALSIGATDGLVADQKRSPKHKSARNWQQAHWMNFLPGPNFGARVTELQSGRAAGARAPERQNVNRAIS
ncbi:hypothetical protein WN51_00218 [Melipona quadrifasciata]|uniref:Uncharacterized protein n=1 Tax=Melipona quadrifasciata TaxID=166423 RepID=A0A0M8ZZJ4_9HYME|nr:hypothetical protein WN51_00218 [Melipona quadrifasciata]